VNAFFRLFITGSVMLILLFLFNLRMDDHLAVTHHSEEIGTIELQPGLLPVEPEVFFTLLFYPDTPDCHGNLMNRSNEICMELLCNTGRSFGITELKFEERKPAMIFKTGQTLHRADSKGDPCLA
jgi:hypothetical protein